MSDVCIVWFKEKQGPCVLCGDETVAGLVGWNQGGLSGPICEPAWLIRSESSALC